MPRTPLPLALLVLVGCPGPKPDPSDDTAAAASVDLSVEVADVQTVLVAKWSTEEPSIATLTATFEGRQIVRHDTVSSKDHEVSLVGFPADTEVSVHLEAVDEDGHAFTADETATTGSLPAWVPELTLTTDAAGQSEDGHTVFSLIREGGAAILGVDELGQVIWYWPASETLLDKTPFRARESMDGDAVLYMTAASDPDTYGEIVRVPLAGGDSTVTPVPSAHTDFVEYTPGGYLAVGWEIQAYGDRQILGDTLVEVAPDGTERVVWDIFDWFEPDLDQTWPQFYGPVEGIEDWSHLNGIAYDPGSDAVYLSSTFNNGVLRVDRASGDLVWTLADNNQGDFNSRSALMSLPHSVEPIDGGVLVFSRGAAGTCSQAVEIALDESVWTANVAWSYQDPGCVHVDYLGSAQRLPGGNTLVGWSTENRVDEVTPEGVIAWSVSLTFGNAIGFVQHVPALGAD